MVINSFHVDRLSNIVEILCHYFSTISSVQWSIVELNGGTQRNFQKGAEEVVEGWGTVQQVFMEHQLRSGFGSSSLFLLLSVLCKNRENE